MLVGIVGVPNSGKSTFFKSLTLADVEIASYPFTTIKPNMGVGYITSECPCKRLGVECSPQNSECLDGQRRIPVKILDVAGLVPGAHEGKGLGNQFLSDLTQASGLVHVLDMSGKTDSEGKAAENWDPGKNAEALEEEIDQWIRDISKRFFDKSRQAARTGKVPIERLLGQQLSGLGVTEEDTKAVMRKLGIEGLDWTEDEISSFSTEVRRISKPIVVAANKIDLPESQKNYGRFAPREDIVPCSADSELALMEASRSGLIDYVPGDSFQVKGKLSESQQRALDFISSNVIQRYGSTGVQNCLNRLVFGKLGMIVVYPVADINKLSDKKGNVLPDAFLVKKGTKLKEFTEKVHTDLAKGFIGGLDLDRKKLGADYTLKDGDVIEILFK
jgi:ribosome-binding ATPase YchF (GTP1/OBG family)